MAGGGATRRGLGGGYLLGLDLGTTTLRAILFDLDGLPVAEAYREQTLHHPRPTWAEIEVDDWWRGTAEVTREALQRAPARRILGVGLSGLMHAMVPVDGQGRPLARAMLWMDQRCSPEAEWLAREHGALITGIMGREAMGTTWSAPKLRWLVGHEPELVRRTAHFLLVKDYVRYRLTGRIATDPGDAGGTLLYDAGRGEWSAGMAAAVGIRLDQLPPVRPSTDVAGEVTAEAAEATGLPAGTPVVVGGGDTGCTCLGAGGARAGRACLYLGTAAWVIAWTKDGARFGSTATTGAALRWLAGLHGVGYEELLAGAAAAPLGARGLLFLPHLMGERGPVPNAAASGAFFGLSLVHGRGDLARAVLEGCAFQLRANLDSLGVPVAELVTVGGGARSPLWRQIIADATGRSLAVPEVLEAGALGAAIMAGVGVGVYEDAGEAAERVVRIAGRCQPDPARHAAYDRIYGAWRELEERVAPLYGRVPAASTEEGTDGDPDCTQGTSAT